MANFSHSFTFHFCPVSNFSLMSGMISFISPKIEKEALFKRLNKIVLFVAVFLGCTSTGQVGLCFLWFLCPGTPEDSTGSGSGFKESQKMGQRLKVSSDRLGEAGNRTCDPWFTRHRFIQNKIVFILKNP